MSNQLISEIKKDFYKYRNGILAEALKKVSGKTFKGKERLIYGLNVPQFNEFAKKYSKDLDVALSLWEENNIRESRIFAIYLFPVEKVDYDLAKRLFGEVETVEECDLLNFKLLRNLPFASQLFEEMSEKLNDVDDDSQKDIQKYCLKMFSKNLDSRNDSL